MVASRVQTPAALAAQSPQPAIQFQFHPHAGDSQAYALKWPGFHLPERSPHILSASVLRGERAASTGTTRLVH